MKGLTTVTGLDRGELTGLITHASRLRDALDTRKPVQPVMKERSVANVFFEHSTRTRLSFDLAAQRLGAHVITFDPATSSTSKGESLRDTVSTVAAMGVDVLVVRHAEVGVPQLVAEWTGIPVINAGDGTNEHPTQALLDAVTIHRHFGRFEDLRMGIVGDIAHSRVAGSLVNSIPRLGVDVTLIGPHEWLPESAVGTSADLDSRLADLDIVYMLRVQHERGSVTPESYVARFQLDQVRLGRMPRDSIVMHPGPMNRGVELTDDVADSPRCKVTEQVRNGVPTRMAVLAAIEGGQR